MVKTNTFGDQVPEIKDLVRKPKVEQRIREVLLEILKYLEIKKAEELVEFALSKAKNYSELKQYEKEVHRIFDKNRVTQRIPVKLKNRAKLIFNQIKDYLRGRDILDLGCGDGKVGEIIAQEHSRDVILVDVYEHGNIANLNLPFGLIKQNRKIPFLDNSFDTTLLLTVLHHSNEPMQVLEEAKRVTKNGGQVIIIESIYGVNAYGNLTNEEQRLVNIFLDHFYNRIIHYNEFSKNKVNVPFNFKTIEEWNKLFKDKGFKIVKTHHLGFDQKTVPEYHSLHILEVKK